MNLQLFSWLFSPILKEPTHTINLRYTSILYVLLWCFHFYLISISLSYLESLSRVIFLFFFFSGIYTKNFIRFTLYITLKMKVLLLYRRYPDFEDDSWSFWVKFLLFVRQIFIISRWLTNFPFLESLFRLYDSVSVIRDEERRNPLKIWDLTRHCSILWFVSRCPFSDSLIHLGDFHEDTIPRF